jgi:membrane-associated phospholipid phosphatase
MSGPDLNPEFRRESPFHWHRRTVGVAVVCCLVALLIAFQLDSSVAAWVQNHANGWSHQVARQVSLWGDWYGVAAVGLIGWWQARRLRAPQWARLWLIMGTCAALAGVSANVIRAVTGRARPNNPVAKGWYGPAKGFRLGKNAHSFQSFPSAHTSVVAGFCAPLGWASLCSRRRRRVWFGMSISVLATLLMAWSRVWLGAHHLSDVLVASFSGWAIGLVWLRYRSPDLALDAEGSGPAVSA